MKRSSETAGLPPRKAALVLLKGVVAEGSLLPELISVGVLAKLSPEDRARAQRLTLEVLRGLERADRMLKPLLQKNPPLAVRNILRLGTIEIAQGAAAHGVVNAMVELTASNKRTRNYKGLVNAVLRRLADDGPKAWGVLPIPKLPPWLRQPMVAAWGRDTVSAMEAVQFAAPPLDLSVKADAGAVAAMVGGEVLPTGSVRIANAGQVTALPGFSSGDWWVQDAAAAMPVRLLGDVKGLHILDLCAAPGGKTLQLAAGEAQVTAVDINETRTAKIHDNLERNGLSADVQVSNAFDVQGQWDAVVLDAPCSATGTIRRHPDLPMAKDGSEFAGLIAQQEQMIDHALDLLKPGGRLVFCTCSLFPDEGEVQVEEALKRHKGIRVDRPDFPGIEAHWRSEEGGLRLRPDYWAKRGGMDGFYMACLTKPV